MQNLQLLLLAAMQCWAMLLMGLMRTASGKSERSRAAFSINIMPISLMFLHLEYPWGEEITAHRCILLSCLPPTNQYVCMILHTLRSDTHVLLVQFLMITEAVLDVCDVMSLLLLQGGMGQCPVCSGTGSTCCLENPDLGPAAVVEPKQHGSGHQTAAASR